MLKAETLLQPDEWDFAIGLRLVLGVIAIRGDDPWPPFGAFFIVHGSGGHSSAVAEDLNPSFRMSNEVPVPRWVLRSTTVGSNNDQPFLVLQIQQGDRVGIAALSPGRGEEEHVVLDKSLPNNAIRSAVQQCVNLRQQLDCWVVHQCREVRRGTLRTLARAVSPSPEFRLFRTGLGSIENRSDGMSLT